MSLTQILRLSLLWSLPARSRMQRTCCGVTPSSDVQCSARSCWQTCCLSLRLSNSGRSTSMQISCSSRSTSESNGLLVGSVCLHTQTCQPARESVRLATCVLV